MSDPNISKKFAVGKAPVNSRLVAPPAPSDKPQAAAARERIQVAKIRQRLGASLSQRLADPRSKGVDKSFGVGQALAGIVGTMSAVGVTLGVIQSSPVLIGAGVLGLAGVGVKVWLGARRPIAAAAPSLDLASLIEPKDISKLDAAIHLVAQDAPSALVDQLAELKAQISACVALVADSEGADALGVDDDRLFLRECIRRYLPDSLTSYLQVPQKDRADLVIDDGKTACALLSQQLSMLGEKLTDHEKRLTQRSGESLMRQQRFLQAKTRL